MASRTVGQAIQRLDRVAECCGRINRSRGSEPHNWKRGWATSSVRLHDIGMFCKAAANSMRAWCLGERDEALRCWALAREHLTHLPAPVQRGLLRLTGMKAAS